MTKPVRTSVQNENDKKKQRKGQSILSQAECEVGAYRRKTFPPLVTSKIGFDIFLVLQFK